MTEQSASPAPIRHFDIELVEEAPPTKKAPPPRASWEQGKSVADAVETPTAPLPGGKSRAYLAGFRHEDEADGSAPAAKHAAPATGDDLKDEIIAALRDIYDPEIPVNIYDLGLIYDIEIEDGQVHIVMTLTTPNCPVAESMPGEVELRVMAVPGVAICDVDLVWEPAWDTDKMTDEAKLELGML